MRHSTQHEQWSSHHFVCLDCRIAGKNLRVCPHCRRTTWYMGETFRVPARDDHRQWAKVRMLAGHVDFQPGNRRKRLPAIVAEVPGFLAARRAARASAGERLLTRIDRKARWPGSPQRFAARLQAEAATTARQDRAVPGRLSDGRLVGKDWDLDDPDRLNNRIAHACKLLRWTGDPVPAIAAAVGMRDVRRFMAAFRALVKLTPEEYRRRKGRG
jgi:AraC-like DNA-binding protein